ncbi:hypothetical protein RC1_0320 [Rhodospirillum centenum SW]|uniref:Uncharacterized protein n=1 Tax=Rhodospirillum centenum (strain ATCC 51521 / SW) TaxID=414684 RepID=B6IQN2_RHOCS|nr:hypothetical protein RC1_0320 [Rhodospirillum centenum SW]
MNGHAGLSPSGTRTGVGNRPARRRRVPFGSPRPKMVDWVTAGLLACGSAPPSGLPGAGRHQ